MFPSQPIKYPEFVADQLLTADNLNDLFGYLDEQGRLTRTNLIGIGIVCGLEVKVNAGGASVTITKGVGITSAGYLIEIPETTYGEYKEYNALKEHIYDRFVQGNPAKQLFHLDELVVTASVEGAITVSPDFLKGKIVLLFVELLRKDAKNCDPDSCDDKGVNVTCTFRPLVVDAQANIAQLLTGINSSVAYQSDQLPVLALPRFDVPATNLVTSADLFAAYQVVMPAALLAQMEQAFQQAYDVFKPFLKDIYNSNPLAGFAGKYAFLQGTPPIRTLVCIQYYYDFMSDMMLAYDELRRKGTEVIAECCPDAELFPRHLLLGPATGNYGAVSSGYRDYFIPAPIQCAGKLGGELRALYTRLVQLDKYFSIPELNAQNTEANGQAAVPVRITPSALGRFTLAAKAIPYYYDLKSDNYSLLKQWNYWLTKHKNEVRNLSYHATDYAVQYPEIIDPLRFDLEPYNFFRIEGIVGKSYKQVMKTIITEIGSYRLPFEVIALKTGAVDDNVVLPEEFDCYFDDLEISYEIVRREWEAIVGKTIEYLNANKENATKYIDSPGAGSLLTPFLQSLYNAKAFMYDSVMDFVAVHLQFMPLMDSIETNGQSIRSKLYQELDVNFVIVGRPQPDKIFLEDLIDHIDALVLSCEKGALRTVYEQYARKAGDLYAKLFLSNFIEDHPGIQHKAGVPSGGTFIVVYHQGKRTSLNDAGQLIPEQPVTKDPNVVADEPPGLVPAPAPAAVLAQSDAIILGQLKRVITPEQAEFLERFIPVKAPLHSTALDELTARIPDGTVIADFYLPYAAKGGCSSISFVISDAPPAEKLIINIEDTNYCSDDTNEYKVSATPTGGTLKGEGISGDDSKGYTFNASKVQLSSNQKSRQILLTYNKEGARPAISTITVYARPTADFDITGQPAYPPILNQRTDALRNEYVGELQFTSRAVNAAQITWDFGDGSPASNSLNPRYNFGNKPGTYTVTLTATNGSGKCRTTATKTIIIAGTSISLDKNSFCSNDETVYPVTLFPANGAPTGLGLINLNGSWQFQPTQTQMNYTVDKKAITLSYTANGQTATFDLTMYQEINFDTAVSQTESDPMTWEFTAYCQFAQTASWDFGDGQSAPTTTEQRILHTYQQPGHYTVTLTAANGTCIPDALTEEITVTAPIVKSCFPVQDIISSFNGLSALNPNLFKAFSASFSAYADVAAFFKRLSEVATKSNEDQLAFFASQNIAASLTRWLTLLQSMILNGEPTKRIMQLSLYNILVRLTLYISCLQPGDVSKGQINTATILQLIARQIKDWLKIVPGFTADEKASAKSLGALFAREEEQVNANGEKPTKPDYITLLEACIAAEKTLNIG